MGFVVSVRNVPQIQRCSLKGNSCRGRLSARSHNVELGRYDNGSRYCVRKGSREKWIAARTRDCWFKAGAVPSLLQPRSTARRRPPPFRPYHFFSSFRRISIFPPYSNTPERLLSPVPFRSWDVYLEEGYKEKKQEKLLSSD